MNYFQQVNACNNLSFIVQTCKLHGQPGFCKYGFLECKTNAGPYKYVPINHKEPVCVSTNTKNLYVRRYPGASQDWLQPLCEKTNLSLSHSERLIPLRVVEGPTCHQVTWTKNKQGKLELSFWLPLTTWEYNNWLDSMDEFSAQETFPQKNIA